MNDKDSRYVDRQVERILHQVWNVQTLAKLVYNGADDFIDCVDSKDLSVLAKVLFTNVSGLHKQVLKLAEYLNI